jgi:rSAM/selenodomain-associated transferase 2
VSNAAGLLSIIIPVRNEAGWIKSTLAALPAGGEYIVVDGDSEDGTTEKLAQLAARRDPPLRLLACEPGRAAQMNAGARVAGGEVLLFLHADTRLPENAPQQIIAAVRGGSPWGRFDVRLEGRSRLLPLVAWLMNRRSRLTGLCTGDQALFVERRLFERVGGFAAIPLMEDLELSQRLNQVAAPACLAGPVRSSGRRWDRHGALRTIAHMSLLRGLYWLGVSPKRLARYYPESR